MSEYAAAAAEDAADKSANVGLSVDSSFFDNFNKAPGEEYFKYIDERINQQIACGMKKALKLMVDKFESHIHKKMKVLVKEQFQHEFEVKVQEIKEAI